MSAAATPLPDPDIHGQAFIRQPEEGGEGDSFAPLYLSGLSWDHSYHPLDLLARLFMLQVYGTGGMTERTRYEIRIAALMLAIVACFELTAWAFVFHQFSDGSTRDTMVVLGAALLVSAAMTMLERSILVSDVDVQGWDYAAVWVKILCRLAIILFVAFRITSQPVELVAFRPSIEQRMFQEDVRRNLAAEATSAINNLQEQWSRFQALATLDNPSSGNDPRKVVLLKRREIEQVHQRIGQAESQLESWRASIGTISAELVTARRNRDQSKAEMARWSGKPETEETKGLREREEREEGEVRRFEPFRSVQVGGCRFSLAAAGFLAGGFLGYLLEDFFLVGEYFFVSSKTKIPLPPNVGRFDGWGPVHGIGNIRGPKLDAGAAL